MKSVQELAAEMNRFMALATRPDGSAFYRLIEGAADWMYDAAKVAHDNGKMLFDDFRFQAIRDALNAIEENADLEEALDKARDSLQPSVYTSELTAWLSSHAYRPWYCDEAFKENGGGYFGIIDVMQNGQRLEMEEVFNQLAGYLQSLTHEDDNA